MATAKKKSPIKKTVDVDAIAATYEKAISDYENLMATKMAEYDAVVKQAQQDLATLVQAATPQPVKPVPEASWSEANGEQYLVLNKAAAEFFAEIFEQVGVLAAELGKMAK